jgi:hypothetical protein
MEEIRKREEEVKMEEIRKREEEVKMEEIRKREKEVKMEEIKKREEEIKMEEIKKREEEIKMEEIKKREEEEKEKIKTKEEEHNIHCLMTKLSIDAKEKTNCTAKQYGTVHKITNSRDSVQTIQPRNEENLEITYIYLNFSHQISKTLERVQFTIDAKVEQNHIYKDCRDMPHACAERTIFDEA